MCVGGWGGGGVGWGWEVGAWRCSIIYLELNAYFPADRVKQKFFNILQ